MDTDPLEALAGRCSHEAWRILEAFRGHRDFRTVVELLEEQSGLLGEQDVAAAILSLPETGDVFLC
jgi:hypothetical protein